MNDILNDIVMFLRFRRIAWAHGQARRAGYPGIARVLRYKQAFVRNPEGRRY